MPVIAEEPVKILIEEETTLIEIVDVPIKTEKELPVPVKVVSDEANIEAKEVEIKRSSVLDPGKIETKQPDLEKLEVSVFDKILAAPSFKENSDVNIEIYDDVTPAVEVEEIPEPVVELIAAAPEMSEDEVVFFDDVVAPEVKTIDIVSKAKMAAPTFRQEPSNVIKVWEAKRGSDLGELLTKWSKEENIKFTWGISESYKLDKDIFISGTFRNAINVVLSKGVKNAPSYVLSDGDLYELNISY